jgi:choline dehydrogenase-like flavoprotein
MFRQGCEKLGIRTTVPPLGINSAPFDGRPPCINRGFCTQGCKPNAKFSTLVHHIPKAIAHGAEVISDSMVTQVLMNDHGEATGVTFNHNGQNYEQKAGIVILANFVIETPRLLMNSATAKFPDGLANSSGWVGKAFMVHSSNDVYGKFPDEIRLYKGTPILATSQEFYETDQNRGFARGYTLHAHGSRPVEMSKGIAKSSKIWGEELRKTMLDYNFYGRITLVGEVLPNPNNQITLSAEKDEYGLPIPNVTFSYGDNDKRLITHAVTKMEEIIEAAGGTPEFVTDDTAHLMGGCRMGDDPKSSVTDSYGRTHDIANLFICSASLFVTSGGGNPTNTIMAIAARTADYIKENYKDIVGG